MSSSANSAARDLAQGGLEELRERYPEPWTKVSEELLQVLSKGNPEQVAQWITLVKADASQWRRRMKESRQNPKVFEAAFPHLLRERLARLALEKTAAAVAAGRSQGTVRLGLWSGSVIQRLLFARGLERKPASMRAFRFWWPWVFDRKLLMPLVQPRGIYCFYSQELLSELEKLFAGRPCLELAAGDGTLARMLRAQGVEVAATDDQSWGPPRQASSEVETLEARRALRKYPSKVVLCSWPPPGNPFEKAVFDSPQVELYVVIGSRHRFAAGNWEAWERQRRFDWKLDERLSALVLPPELDPAVYVFRRKPDG